MYNKKHTELSRGQITHRTGFRCLCNWRRCRLPQRGWCSPDSMALRSRTRMRRRRCRAKRNRCLRKRTSHPASCNLRTMKCHQPAETLASAGREKGRQIRYFCELRFGLGCGSVPYVFNTVAPIPRPDSELISGLFFGLGEPLFWDSLDAFSRSSALESACWVVNIPSRALHFLFQR